MLVPRSAGYFMDLVFETIFCSFGRGEGQVGQFSNQSIGRVIGKYITLKNISLSYYLKWVKKNYNQHKVHVIVWWPNVQINVHLDIYQEKDFQELWSQWRISMTVTMLAKDNTLSIQRYIQEYIQSTK